MKTTAIILAGGRGKRMQSDIPKQYLELNGYPLLYYTIKAFEASSVDDIILVCAEGEEQYCRDMIIDRYGFQKITAITHGGAERYNSVYNALCCITDADYVLIHDGARPLIRRETIELNIAEVQKDRACVTAVPSKDTIKISNKEGYVQETPDRAYVWNIQTPQTFDFELIRQAYEKILTMGLQGITDDAMVVEHTCNVPVKLIMGDYTNIKVTTPEDLDIAQILVDRM